MLVSQQHFYIQKLRKDWKIEKKKANHSVNYLQCVQFFLHSIFSIFSNKYKFYNAKH